MTTNPKRNHLVATMIGCLSIGAGSASADVFVDLGNNPAATQLNQVNPAVSVNALDVAESSAFTTGTFTTTGAGPVTFDLTITATNGFVQGQDKGFGVTGGTAGLGIDNSNTAGPLESMTFTISDFTGLGAGESLEISSISVLFGTETESYTIDGGSSTLFSINSDGGNPAEVISVSGTTVTIGAGTAGDTKFAIDGITVSVVGGGGGTTFADWQAANGGAGSTGGIDEDHDDDGVLNGVEFFLGGPNDTTGFTALPGVDDNTGTLSVTWTRHPDYPGTYGTDYVVETSSTLSPEDWSPADPGDVSGDLTYTFPNPLVARDFARLRVAGPVTP